MLFFVHFVTSAYSIVQFLALLLIVIVILVTIFYRMSIPTWFKWILLFLATLITQLLVSSTGGLYSPFLILFHFLILGINLFWLFAMFEASVSV